MEGLKSLNSAADMQLVYKLFKEKQLENQLLETQYNDRIVSDAILEPKFDSKRQKASGELFLIASLEDGQITMCPSTKCAPFRRKMTATYLALYDSQVKSLKFCNRVVDCYTLT